MNVLVKFLEIDDERRRVSLSMKRVDGEQPEAYAETPADFDANADLLDSTDEDGNPTEAPVVEVEAAEAPQEEAITEDAAEDAAPEAVEAEEVVVEAEESAADEASDSDS